MQPTPATAATSHSRARYVYGGAHACGFRGCGTRYLTAATQQALGDSLPGFGGWADLGRGRVAAAPANLDERGRATPRGAGAPHLVNRISDAVEHTRDTEFDTRSPG
jgi:hypothetical protein